ncbi:MAG: M48 family metallopeptidase [Alphaproteobacteria bacterium]|nr:M48 family metallopeptidase [Alphaproteobacteria bacterium]
MPAALGLSTYRWNNNIKSVLLLLAFPLLLLTLVGVVFYAFGWASADPSSHLVPPQAFQQFNLQPALDTARPEDFALSAIYTYWPLVTGIAAIWVLVGYFFNSAMLRAATGAKPVTRTEAPKLYNMLENLCIARGMKVPAFYIIDSDALNAFASGVDEKSYAITVTRGLLQRLDDKEMEAVLAHELSHIINRDCRLLIITIVFVGMISFLAQMLWRSMRFAAYGRNRSRNGKGGGAALFLLIAAIAALVGYVLALVLRFAISRKREYLADAGSVELTKNPEALIGALRKISGHSEIPNVPPEVQQLFIENKPSGLDLGGIFATHPPLEDRIRVLQQLGGLPAEGKSFIPNS